MSVQRILLGFAIVPMLLASGCGASVASVCQQVCECDGKCSETELAECQSEGDALQKVADAKDCSAEFQAYLDCLDTAYSACGTATPSSDQCGAQEAAVEKCGVDL